MPQEDSSVAIGSVLAGLGAIGFVILVLAGLESLPLAWQRDVRGNAPLWCLGSGLLLIAGVRQLWYESHQIADWTPTRPGKRFNSVVVYTRRNCPLCEEAMEVLARYQPWLSPVVEVAIDDDPALQQRFGESVPVVEMDGRWRFRGCIHEPLLRRLIEGTPPRPALRRR